MDTSTRCKQEVVVCWPMTNYSTHDTFTTMAHLVHLDMCYIYSPCEHASSGPIIILKL